MDRPLKRAKIQTGGDFSFELIDNLNELVGPVYLSDLIMKPHKIEYELFDKYLIDNYGDNMKKLISQIFNVDCPISIRVKYWLRAYTLETNFYKDMNSDLMKEKTKLYLPYIKLVYYALSNNAIKVNTSNDLYRGALINKEELSNLINHMNERKNSDIPRGLIYCKSFMSFSLDKNVALGFMNNKPLTEKTIRVLYILKGESGLDKKNATNADLNGISYFEEEDEILLFPFSVYEINKIKKSNNFYKIYINYLGKYKEIFNIQNQTKLYNSIINSNFMKKLELAGLLVPIWLAKKCLCKIIIKNCCRRGSGFCCSIPLPNEKTKIPVLMTCNHVLGEEELRMGNEIIAKYDDGNVEIRLKINKNSKIYTNKNLDVTIIEIKENIDIKNNMIFMDIDEDIFNNIDFLKKNINRKREYLLQYAEPNEFNKYNNEMSGYIIKKNIEEFTKNKDYRIEEGDIKIDDKDENKIIHNIPSTGGASGGPIIFYNKFRVIGIHQARYNNDSYMYGGRKKIGILLKKPIQEFIERFYN